MPAQRTADQAQTQTAGGDDRPVRGRGRPRKENPLSGAERARRCRARKRLDGISGGATRATKNRPELEEAHAQQARLAALTAEILRLQAALAAQQQVTQHWRQACRAASRDAADLQGLARLLVDARLKRQPVPADVFARLATSPLLVRQWQDED